MSDSESQEKGSSSENEDPFNLKNVTQHAETKNESAIEHVKKPYDQGDIITESDGDSPRKKRHWDSEEEKESTITFKKDTLRSNP